MTAPQTSAPVAAGPPAADRVAAGRAPSAPRRAGVTLLAVVAFALAGCSGDGPADPAADKPLEQSAQGTAAVPPVVTATEAPTGDDAATATGSGDEGVGAEGAGEPSGDDAAATSLDDSMPPPLVDTATATGTPGDDAYDPDPRVAVVERFAEEYARAATGSDPDRAEWLATMTQQMQDDRMTMLGPDLGWTYPGPLPLTVTQVVTQDGVDKVETCMMVAGFAIDPATGAPSEQTLLQGVEFHLAGDAADGYLVDGIFAGGNECDMVQVEGRTW